jgi:transposase
MPRVVIGVDPHKASNTVVVIDAQERVLAQQRFPNDRAGYRSMRTFARTHRDRVWAVEGARGVGAGLAQRLVADGEPVLDVPARLSARVRALGGGSGARPTTRTRSRSRWPACGPGTCRWCARTTRSRSCACSARAGRRSSPHGSRP